MIKGQTTRIEDNCALFGHVLPQYNCRRRFYDKRFLILFFENNLNWFKTQTKQIGGSFGLMRIYENCMICFFHGTKSNLR